VRQATRLIIEERFLCAFAPVCLDDAFEAGVALLEVLLCRIGARSAPPSYLSGCSTKSDGAPKCSARLR
jgi:hypothetical protein